MRRPPVSIVALFACCIAALLSLPSAASAKPGVALGYEQFGNMENPQYTDAFQQIMRRDGATVQRYVVRWDWVARACDPTTKGNAADMNNACYSWGYLDEIVRKARANGLTMLFSIYGTPKWMFNGSENFTGTTDAQFQRFLTNYANFAQAVATRYDGRHGQVRVERYTIWNEANGTFMEPRWAADGTLIGPTRYAQMVDQAARRIKAVDPSLLVAAGPTAPLSQKLPPYTFLEQVLPQLQRLGTPIDAWAHNAYSGGQSPIYDYTIKRPFIGLGNIADLTGIMDQYSVTAGKPVWITEFGYQTGGGQKAIELSDQPRLLADALYFAWAQPRIDTFVWYQLHDDPSGPTYNFMSALYYELGTSCGSVLCPKPGAAMYRHTIWASRRAANGAVVLWAQGRTAPEKTRLFVKRPNDGWRAYVNSDTATTGTVHVTMTLPVGTIAMACDTACGPTTTVAQVAQGGGVSVKRATVKRLKAITLDRRLALRRGIVLGVGCGKAACRVTGQLRARGRASGFAKARTRTIVVGNAKVTRGAKRTTAHLRFTPAARRELSRRTRGQVTLRLVVRYIGGSTTIYDRVVRLR